MAIEIERKYLVTADTYQAIASTKTAIKQGYLCSVPERTVRVRIKGEKGYITIKGQRQDSGLSGYEWEKEIPVFEAEELMKLCEPGIIDKIRYEIKADHHTIEVDEFHGDNQGLVMAEVELHHATDQFHKPAWLGKEVTGDVRYYNSMLMKHPYVKW